MLSRWLSQIAALLIKISQALHKNTKSCACSTCTSACTSKPGWFLPGEVTQAAHHLGITQKEVFDQSLAVDWYRETLVLAPAVIGHEGRMYPEDAYEQCVFFQNNKCSIHAVKPFECRNYLHDTSKKELQATHDSVAAAWVDHQSEVYEISPNANIPKTP